MKFMEAIDSHTGGEPTRIIIGGGPDLGGGTLADKARVFSESFDQIRTAVIGEPRGNEVLVGGLLCEAEAEDCSAGVIFFDNAGLLGMCGHGTIGLAVTLNYLGRMEIGGHRIETPVGNIDIELLNSQEVRFKNVASYRTEKAVSIQLQGFGKVTGDVVWGGNWFFLTEDRPCELTIENSENLLAFCKKIRTELNELNVTGDDGSLIQHIEIQSASPNFDVNSRNFVLCPGGAFDRSPCGTGTSAKIACLAEDGKLKAGEIWRQESIVGSVFEGTFEESGKGVLPILTGKSFVTAELKLVLDEADPFLFGIGR